MIVLGAEEGKLPGYSGSAGVLTDQERVTLRELGVPLTGGAMEGVQAEFRGNLRLLLRCHGVGERVLLRRPAVLLSTAACASLRAGNSR